ncbi:hypothetical protein LTR94_029139, partial [Friedmanniomyces endolithicus]
GQSLRSRALSKLAGALKVTVLEDGSHASRSPEAGLELLLDLLILDDALAQLSEPTPQALSDAIGKLTQGVRTLQLPDGRLASFQGGGPSNAERVAAACVDVEAKPASDPTTSAQIAEIGGLVRIASPLLTIIADAASPARGAWAATACAQPMALEISCGKDRLMTGSGWTPAATERQALRLTPAHSTLTLGERSLNEPLGGWKGELLGARLAGPPIHVTKEHREGDGAVWLEMEHDGWSEGFGLNHQRRLYLDQRLDELRAEEKLFPTPE